MPGTITTIVDQPSTQPVRAASGLGFMVGLTQRGATDKPIVCRSFSQVKSKTGDRVSYGFIYDAAEVFFALGGEELVIGRVVGATPVKASHVFVDGAAAPALTVTAREPGDWANGATGGITVQIAAGGTGGTFILTIRYAGQIVETSPELADVAAAIAWARDSSSYVAITDPGATADPAVIAATNLTAGTDDRGTLSTTTWQTALTVLRQDTRAGQIAAPGMTTAAIQQAVVDHADAANRTAYADLIDSATAATVAAAVASLTGATRKRAAVFAPWAVINGITAGTTRVVPWSAVQMGMTARNDGGGDPPAIDDPVAADNGKPGDVVIGLSQSYTPADLDVLDAAQINTVRVIDGEIQTYGNQTLANRSTQAPWVELTAARTLMYAADQGNQIAKRRVFNKLDPQGKTIGRYGLELEAMLTKLHDNGQIFNDPATAVDVGPGQNTTTTIAARQLHGVIAVKPSPSAWTVYLNVGAEA